jgi:probable rRNA maturation factor
VAVTVTRQASLRVAGFPTNRTIERRLNKMLDFVGHPRAHVSVMLTNDEEIRLLNLRYRHKNKSTDILSFSVPGDGFALAGDVLGDLAISVETVERQALAGQRSTRDELTLLLAHGLLHLLGMDHKSIDEDKKMRARADELCISAGSKPFFALGAVDDHGRPKPVSEKLAKKRAQKPRIVGVLR